MSNPLLTDTEFRHRYGPWALVCGASEGTGAEFSLQAAARGLNLLMVARRAEKLEELAARIRSAHGVQVRTLSLDLASPSAAETLRQTCASMDIGLLVLNAGGDSVGGRFLDSSMAVWRKLLQRNIDFLTECCHDFANAFVKRGRGGIVLVGSEAALGGTGRLALYTATKGYALNLGESLWQELKPQGVDVLNLLIGATDTPKLRGILTRNGLPADAVSLTPAGEVAKLGLDRLGGGPTVVLNAADDTPDARMNEQLRRERVHVQSKFLDHFYGPSSS